MATLIVDGAGVASVGEIADIQSRVAEGKLLWVDLVGEDEATRSACLRILAIEDPDVGWCQRFGQSGRMNIRPQRVRASTWIADASGSLIEIHVIGAKTGVATVWSGDAAILDHARQQFADRVAGLEGKFFLAAGILLQLLLTTLDAAVLSLDERIDLLRAALDRPGEPVDFSAETRRLQTLQTFSASFSRYSSAVRSAMVGVEALPEIGPRGADELNDYVEQVEDLEEQLYERRRWLSEVTHEFATAIAQRQSEQISRLTVISTIFLPVTAITGYFGMNFQWMTDALAGREVFFILGVVLPIACMIGSVAWLGKLGVLRSSLWR